MGKTYTVEELEKCSKEELMRMLLAMRDQMERMNGNLENLIEQIRVANQQKFGRHTEKLEAMEGQLSFFNEAEYLSEEALEEEPEDIFPKKPRNKKQRGKREADLKDFPEEPHDHDIPQEELDRLFGKGCCCTGPGRNSAEMESISPGRSWRDGSFGAVRDTWRQCMPA